MFTIPLLDLNITTEAGFTQYTGAQLNTVNYGSSTQQHCTYTFLQYNY